MIDQEKLREAFSLILSAIGEDGSREGVRETPERAARMYAELFAGLSQDPRQCLEKIFTADSDDLVPVKDIDFYSMCEHHLMPFFGKIHIAYLPADRRIAGLSKLVRLTEALSRRPQIQEKLTGQIADMLTECLRPRGALVVCEARHLCMSMRGVKNTGALTVTLAARGVFEADGALQDRTLAFMRGGMTE